MVKTKNGTTCLALYLGTVCKYGEYYKCDTKNGTIPILQKKKLVSILAEIFLFGYNPDMTDMMFLLPWY